MDRRTHPFVKSFILIALCILVLSKARTVNAFDPAPTPTNVQASDGTSDEYVTVSWNAPSYSLPSDIKYAILVQASETEFSEPLIGFSYYFTCFDPCPTTSFDHPDAESGKLYYFHVSFGYYDSSLPLESRFYGFGGTASDSGWKKPEKPTGLLASGDDPYEIYLSWNAVPGKNIIYQMYKADVEEGPFLNLGGTQETSHRDRVGSPGDGYYYYVKACYRLDSGTITDRCGDNSFTAFGYRPYLYTVENTYATDGAYGDKVRVTWGAVHDAIYYEIQRSTNGSDFTSYAEAYNTSFDDFSVTQSTTYYYKVRACQAEYECGFYGASDSGFVAPMNAPQNVKATNGEYSNKIIITFNTISGANGYEIYRSITPNETKFVVGLTANPSFVDFPPTDGVYYYWVKACSLAGCSDFSLWDAGSTIGDVPTPIGVFNGSVEISATQPVVAIGRPHFGLEVASYNGATTGALTNYLPMLFNNKWGYTSTFTVQNTGAGEATYTITFKDANDGSTSCILGGETLAVHSARTYDVTNLGTCYTGEVPTDWFGGATILSDEPLAVIAKPDINGTDAVSYSAFTGGAEKAYLPMLFRGKWGYQSAFYVQNLDDEDATLKIEFYDISGALTCTYYDNIEPLGPDETRGYWMQNFNNIDCTSGTGFDLVNGWAGSAVIKTEFGGSIVAIGRPHMGTEVAAYNGVPSGSTENYLPMLFRGQWGYNAAIYIQNVSGSPSDIEVEFYDTDGNPTCIYTDPIPVQPNATRGYWTPTITCTSGGNFPTIGWAGSAKVISSQNVIAVGRPHLANSQVVVYNAFTGGTTKTYVPYLFRNYGSNESALYIQNLGAIPTVATITYYDEESSYFCTMEKSIQPGASNAIWLAGLTNAVCVP